MAESFVLHHATVALYLVMWLSLPVLVVVSLIGLIIGVLQALTQIQDQTLPFALKLIGAVLTLVFSASWISAQAYSFGLQMFTDFAILTR